MAALPPLANFVAIRDASPPRLLETEQLMRSKGKFEEIFRPHPEWVVGVSRLPDSTPDSREVREAGLVFAEGRARLERGHEKNLTACFQQIAQMVRGAPKNLQHLPGDFTFLHFADSGEVVAVRSVAGTVPLYAWQRPGRAALSTQMGSLIVYGGVPTETDDLVCGLWAIGNGVLPGGRTHLKNVRLIPKGAYLVLSADHQRGEEYWTPPAPARRPPGEETQKERAQQLRPLLLNYLSENLHPDGVNLLTFSGGVDSSCLLVLAASLDREVCTWTELPVSGASRDRELSFVLPLLEQLKIRRAWITDHADARIARTLRREPYTHFPVFDPSLVDLPRLRESWNVRVIFGGLFADELCGSGRTMPDWCLAVSPIYVAQSLIAGRSQWMEPLRWLKHRLLWAAGRPLMPVMRNLPATLLPALREEYRGWFESRTREVLSRTSTHYFMRASLDVLDGYLLQTWEAGSALGIRRLAPFFNRDILEFGFATHPAEKIRPLDKKILRRALEGLIPERVLLRPDKGGRPDQSAARAPIVESGSDSELAHRTLDLQYIDAAADRGTRLYYPLLRCEHIVASLNYGSM